MQANKKDPVAPIKLERKWELARGTTSGVRGVLALSVRSWPEP